MGMTVNAMAGMQAVSEISEDSLMRNITYISHNRF